MPPKHSKHRRKQQEKTKLVVYKTIKTLSLIEFMLNDKTSQPIHSKNI